MFAVPGWSVSASSLVREQKDPKPSKKSTHQKTSKKRKREHETAEHENAPQQQQQPQPTPNGTKSIEAGRNRAKNDEIADNVTSDVHAAGHVDSLAKQHGSQTRTRTDSGKSHHKRSEKNTSETVPGKSQARALATPGQTAQPGVKLTPLQEKMRNKLTSARFRHLNEKLYTTSSSDALSLFTQSPELFAEYHAGFAQQVKDSWPQNPVDGYIKSLKIRGALFEPKQGVVPLPRRKTGSCTIADLGCGDAPLARGCQSATKTLQLKFHNYDLHTPNSHVTRADISNLPLRDGEADIAVFCLSLMGTNWISFVEEAWRVVRGDGKGEVWVAEVKSRFGKVVKGRVVENSVGKRRKTHKPKSTDEDDPHSYDAPEQFVQDERNANDQDDETDVSNFVKVFTRRGFQLKEDSVIKNNKMFVSMVFFKSGIPTAGKHKGLKWNGKEYVKQAEAKARYVSGQRDNAEVSLAEEAKTLKPCVYKTR